METYWQQSALASSLDPSNSALREILELSAQPQIRSFAVGLVGEDLLPVRALADSAARVIEADRGCLQYQLPPFALKGQISRLLALRGFKCRREEIFLTAGIHQGMDFITRMLANPGQRVVVEETVYEGFLTTARTQGVELVAVPTSPDRGMDLDALEDLLGRDRPAFVYTIPSGHNPVGVSLSLESRHRLADLARRFRVPVVEDDAYGFLSYGDDPPPALRSLCPEWVFYLGSFSKILAPALRVGWMVVPEAMVPKLGALKNAGDANIGTLSQRVVSQFLEDADIEDHIALLRRSYRARRDAMLEALRGHLPESVRWSHPDCGMFVWVELPEGVDSYRLFQDAVAREKIAFCPGRIFSAQGGAYGSRCLRLSFANHTAEGISAAIPELARAVRRALPRDLVGQTSVARKGDSR